MDPADWGIVECVAVLLWAASAATYILAIGSTYLTEYHEKKRSEFLLDFILSGRTGPVANVRGHVFLTLEVIKLGEIYRKYIGGLPIARKRVIVETLLANASRATGNSNIPSLISHMNDAELETIGQIVLEGKRYNSMALAKNEMANAVILFCMNNPRD